MSADQRAPTRGRPPTITRKRIADAGIAIGLSDLTVVGVAARLGISHMGLYKHVSSLSELREMVAEEIFLRWQLPSPQNADSQLLEQYLTTFAKSIWNLVAAHPGIAPYLLRSDMITPAMTEKIVASQKEFAVTCGISFQQSRWLLLTIAFHCVAVADTALPKAQSAKCCQSVSRDEIDPEYAKGIRALIVGALAVLDGAED